MTPNRKQIVVDSVDHEDEAEEEEEMAVVVVVGVEVALTTNMKEILVHLVVKTKAKCSVTTVKNMVITQLNARIREKKETMRTI